MKYPKLRFKSKDGSDFPDWSKSKLNEIADINPKTESLPENFIYIDLDSVSKGSLSEIKVINKSNAPSRAQRLLSNDDIIFQMVRPYLQNNMFIDKQLNLPIVASTGYSVIRANNVTSKFLYYSLHSERFLSDVLIRCTGGTYPAINSSSLSEINTYYPCAEEQQKIASFFTLLDRKIKLSSEKLTSLEKMKKGLLQQIFSKTLSSASAQWDEVNLKVIAKKVSDKNTNRACQNALTNSAEKGVISQSEFFERDIAQKEHIDKYTLVQKGDFIYNPRISKTAPAGPINRSAFDLGVVSPLYTVFRLKADSRVAPEFLAYYFISNLWVRYMESVANYGARFDRMSISNADFFDMPIPCPTTDEQQKIIKLLTCFDQKLDIARKQLEALQKLKKGLIEQMFV
ncbi:MAG: restriction endonuclease subunit S [Proteobacteria bacterium]|uniref:Restriction endonuclease subunit S n=1 Tax=Candidatus Avisuccinivibrio stercorigallinarum TaxID=2840704 RepID=A0A9D9DA97_9GAMM|nr:restriction endonuclease subunit S [Candidatus Avisuccinivibrio stercorigallinarum]